MILVDFTVNECPDLNRLYCSWSQPSLISHDSETVPAAYSRFDTISPLALFLMHAHLKMNTSNLILPKLILLLHLNVKMFKKNSDVAKKT